MEGDKRPDEPYIEILPIGKVDWELLVYIRKVIEDKFILPVKIGRAIRISEASFDPARNQYNASKLLGELSRSIAPRAAKALGVIDRDIFSEGLNYVFGQARLGGCCGIISLARLRQGTQHPGGRTLLLERIEKEAIHELGHSFGLKHCSNPRCVMFFSNGIEDTDRKTANFCPECGITAYAKGVYNPE